MQITEDKTIEVEQNADRLADFIMFAQRSFLLDLSKELNKGNISYAQFFLLGYPGRTARHKTAAFLLMFDDGWPSHWQVAVPALVARQMTATFYINPAKGEFRKFEAKWSNEVWRAGMAYGNHTMTRKGRVAGWHQNPGLLRRPRHNTRRRAARPFSTRRSNTGTSRCCATKPNSNASPTRRNSRGVTPRRR